MGTVDTRLRAAMLLAPALLLFAPSQSNAQATAPTNGDDRDGGASSDIIVTATKRDTRLLDVPFSVNVQTLADIQRSGARSLEDISRNVAGLTIQNLGPGQSQVAVRGVSSGQIARDVPALKEQVGIYLDESAISLSLFTPDIDLFDLNRLETLRGPQGTLFGAGSEGGTVRYITNQPTVGKIEGSIESDVNVLSGGDVGWSSKGAINLPLSDSAAIRAVAYHTHYAGFIDTLRDNGSVDKNTNTGDRTGGRVAMLLKPFNSLTLTPRIVYQEIKTNGFNREDVFNLFGNAFTTPARPATERQQLLLSDESFSDKTLIGDLTAALELGSVSATSVTSFTKRNLLTIRDGSTLTGYISRLVGFPVPVTSLPSTLIDRTNLKTFAQELRLASSGAGKFQWLVGGFYSNIRRNYSQRINAPGYGAAIDGLLGPGAAAAIAAPYSPDDLAVSNTPYDTTQKAVFGEVSYQLGRIKGSAGLRYYDFDEKRNVDFVGFFATPTHRVGERTSSDGFTPRFLLSYELSSRTKLNAQVSKGFRLGGINDPLPSFCSAPDAALFGPFSGSFRDETLWNYEVGVKSSSRSISFGAAAFYNDLKNLQIPVDTGSCSTRLVFNVPKAHTMGIEADLTARPLRGLEIALSGAVLKTEFDSSLPRALATATGIRDGNRLPTSPKLQFSANVSYRTPVDAFGGATMFVAGSVQHVGNRYTQAGDQEQNPRTFSSGIPYRGASGTGTTVLNLDLPSYELVNLNAGLDFRHGLSLTVYVNNLFDVNALLSFDREIGGSARLGYNVGQPRTIGLTVHKSF